jgi:tetratricopeptide (TPR) repeat protein
VTTDAVDGLLEQAWTVYRGVVTDPGTYAGQAGPLADAARRSRDHEAHVVALRAQAWAERSRLADGRAKTLLDEAARVARRHGLSARLVEILTSRSAVNLELGRIPAARRDLDLAEAMAGEHGTAALALQHAVLLHNLGRLTEAATYYRRALADSTAAPETRATVANNLALVEMVHGRVPEAFAALDEAQRAAAGAGPALVALVTQTSGWVSVQAGRISEGLARFDSAARLYAAAGLPLAEHYLEYVDALVDLRLLPEALATSRAAVEELDGSDVVLMAAEARLRLARLALLSGDPDRAADVARGAARCSGPSTGRPGRPRRTCSPPRPAARRHRSPRRT